MTDLPNSAQAEFWSDGGGLDWITYDAQLDELFAGVNAALLKLAAPKSSDCVVDVGCGTGATTFDFSHHVLSVHGIDISTTMLARAKESARENTIFSCVDAQTASMPQDHYDHLISRFGVMFFDDPVAAFTNLRSMLNANGSLTVACWGPFKQNPWFTIPRKIATDLLGSPPPHDPRAAGPFAFADTDYALGILTAAGFANPQVTTLDIPLSLKGSAAKAAKLAANIGPADSVIRAMNGTPADKSKIIAATEEKLAQYATNDAITVPAKIHFYTAQNTD